LSPIWSSLTELEPLLLGEAPLRRHQQKAGIGLGRDDPVFPRLGGRLGKRRVCGSDEQRAGRRQPDEDESCHLMVFQSLARSVVFGRPGIL